MKTIVSLCAFLLLTMGMNAQNRERMRDMNPEQFAELRTKQLTLDLVLNEEQQKKVYALQLEAGKKMKERMAARKQGERPSDAERTAMMNTRLDEQIAMQEKMQKILTDDQFKKWKKHQEDAKKRFGERRRKN